MLIKQIYQRHQPEPAKCPLDDYEWWAVCSYYEQARHKKQRKYRRETGDMSPYQVPIPNRKLSHWEDTQSGRRFVLRNVDGMLMTIKESTLKHIIYLFDHVE
jgi:hypothetical protein